MKNNYKVTAAADIRAILMAMMMVVGVLAATAANAQMYATDRSGNYGVMDCDNGNVTLLCPLPTIQTIGATEIEFDINNGIAWVQGVDGNFSAQSFHPLTCAPLSAVIFNGSAFNGLEYINGVLYGTGIPSPCTDAALYTINPGAGTTVAIGPTNTGRPVSGLAYDEANGILYGVTGCGTMGPSDLVTISLADGSATLVGNTGRRLGSLEFGCNGTLLAGGDSADGGNIYVIDTTDASATLLGPSGLAQVTGLTSADMATPTDAGTWGRVKSFYR